jgi:DNA repair protein RadC
VAHNHPSGDPSPSPEDVAITKEIVTAGKLLSIDVLDHIVVGRCQSSATVGH